MNVFYVDNDPELAAQALCNKHVIKMILESAQLLCTVHHIIPIWKDTFPNNMYRATHINHPCSKWVRRCNANYCWLSKHAISLCEEYIYRFNKIHASTTIIQWCWRHIAAEMMGYGTEPAQAMPNEFKISNDPVKAYRRYYNEYKRYTIDCRWTKREPPIWWTEYAVSSIST